VVVYVDVTTVPVVGDGNVTAVDLDLDVVRTLNSRVFLDDEAEFQQHQIDLDYPAEIVELATSTAARLMAHVAQRIEPFDRAADHWLDLICRQ
jgi:protein associated with RNAse G/E